MAENRLGLAVVKVDGRELAADAYRRLAAVRVEESTALPDLMELRFTDPTFDLFDAGTIEVGARMEIALRAEGDPVIVSSGEITAVSVEPGLTGRHEFVVTAMDLSHRLARVPKRRTFVSMSDADIADQIAAEYSLTAQIDRGGATHDHVLQANETDLAFLRRRAVRNGQSVWVTGDTLHVARRSPGSRVPKLTWGANLLEFDARFSSTERADQVEVRAWDAVAKQAIVGTASDPDARTDAQASDKAINGARDAFGRIERTAVAVVVADQQEADAVATALLARSADDGVLLRGVAVGDPEIAAGDQVELQEVGQRLAGRYTATAVVHRWSSSEPYTTQFCCGPQLPAGLADLVAPPESELRAVLPHLMAAQVTNTDDPLRLGRAKVSLPSLSGQDESWWARVVVPGGGPSRGIQWLPEVGDEVVVGFEQGDPTRPYLLGGVWNDSDPLPEPDAAQNGRTERWAFVTRKGTKVILHDDPTEKIEIVVADTGTSLTMSREEVSLVGAQKLVIEAQQIEVKAQQNLKLSGQSEVVVSGGQIKLN